MRDGEVVSLIGPSGCGKSTLLNIGSGLTAPSEGEAFVDGERVDGPNAHVAFMLQKDLLLPWRTVAENVMFGVEIQGVPAAERRQRAQALLENFNLAEFSGHYPHQLSGGMRQRVAWRARSPSIRTCCCSTSRSPRWTRRPAWCCSATSRRRSSRRARPRSSSPMISPKR